MNKLASLKYDIVDYAESGGIEKIASISGNLSKEARQYEIPDSNEIADKPTKDFALVIERRDQEDLKKFANYDKEITELNLNILEGEKDNLPDEVVKVASHNLIRSYQDKGESYKGSLNDFYDEDKGFKDPHIKLASIDERGFKEKVSSVKSIEKWAMPSVAKYPLETAGQIKEANNYFDKHEFDFDADDAIEFATNVKEAADERDDVSATRVIEKYASVDTESFNDELPMHIDIRKSHLTVDQDEEYELYDNFTKTAHEVTPQKAAKLLESIDKEAELDSSWGKGIEHPFLSVLGKSFEKRANAGPSLENLQALNDADLTKVVGNSTIKELKGEDGVAVYNSLPTPIKKEVDNLLDG